MKTAEVQIPPGNIELCLLITSPYITCLTRLGRHHRKAISVRNEGGRRCYFPSLTQTSIMSPYPPQLTIPTETSIPDWCSSNHHPSPNTQIIPQPLQGPSIRQRWRILHINPSLVCFYAGCISSVGLCKRQIQILCSLEQFKPKVLTIYSVVFFLLFLSIEVNTCNSFFVSSN